MTGSNNAVNAGARRFDRSDFVGALHQAEGHKNGQQHDQWRHVVEQIGSDVQQVLGDDVEPEPCCGGYRPAVQTE